MNAENQSAHAVVVDARGVLCPQPLIMTKRALVASTPGQPMRILIDNETSKNNVVRFLSDNKIPQQCTEHAGLFTLSLFSTQKLSGAPAAESYCTVSPTGAGTVIAFKSNRMGAGSDELGEILCKALINTLGDVAPLPASLVFYNSGVLLTTNDSAVADSLRALEQRNVKLLVCGTCVEYFGKKDEISMGTISNMYTILETLMAAKSVIEP